MNYYRKAAEQNHAKSQSNLGIRYFTGEGVEQNYVEVVKWWRKAANQNHAKAQYNLGNCYARGIGVAKDYAEAVKWFFKAAEQNDVMAQSALGNCYANGQGCKIDNTEAVKWWRKAAEQDHAQAQNNLGVCYDKGIDVAKDEVEAVKWYRKTATIPGEQFKFAGEPGMRPGEMTGCRREHPQSWLLALARQAAAATMRAMSDTRFMRLALRLARRGCGATSPNPMVGAVLVKGGKIIGRGWHWRAGLPHAEIEALRDAQKRGHNPRGATLYVTLEPCCTHGRTPPCTEAIISAGIKKVVIGAIDPNPKHSGKAFKILRRAGIEVGSIRVAASRQSAVILSGKGNLRHSSEMPLQKKIADECERLNEAFNHWIIYHTPFVTVKAAMTMDGKIATSGGESKWITGEKARAHGMKLRHGSDAILVGINTILADDPGLTARRVQSPKSKVQSQKALRRFVLDSMARTPLDSKVVSDEFAALTTIVVSKAAPKKRVAALAKKANVLVAPAKKAESGRRKAEIDLRWLLKKLGSENVTSLLVEGGGEVNASFLFGGFAQSVAFFYAPKILGGRDAHKAVAGDGAKNLSGAVQLREIEWKQTGGDLLMTAKVVSS